MEKIYPKEHKAWALQAPVLARSDEQSKDCSDSFPAIGSFEQFGSKNRLKNSYKNFPPKPYAIFDITLIKLFIVISCSVPVHFYTKNDTYTDVYTNER